MLRFLRKYNKIILVVGGCLLMIAFLAQGTVDQLITQPGERAMGTVDGRDITAADVEEAARDMRLVQGVSLAFSVHYRQPNMTNMDLPTPLDPMQWILMLIDANKMGLSASRSEAIELLEHTNISPDRFNSVLRQSGVSEDRVLRAIQNWSIVQQYMSLVLGQRYVHTGQRLAGTATLDQDQELARYPMELRSLVYARRFANAGGMPRVSEPMVKRFIYDQSAVAEITAVEIKSDQYLNVISAPTPEELKALFDKYKDYLPGESEPYGFGYKYADRVKLEYIKVPFDRVLELVKNDASAIAELEAEAYEYYVRNKDDYIILPNLPPVNLPPSGQFPIPGTNPLPGVNPIPGTNPTKGDGKDDTKKDATKDGASKTNDTKDASDSKDGNDSKDAGKKSGNATDLILPRDTVEVFLQDDAKTDAPKKDGDAKNSDAKKTDTKPTPPAPTKDEATKTDATKDAPKKGDATKSDAKDSKNEKDAGKTDGKTDLPRVPVIEYQPFRNVRKGIIDTLQRQKAEKLVGKITKTAQTILLGDVRALSQEAGYYKTDKEGWTTTSLSTVAKKIQEQFGLLPDVVRYDGEWLNEEAIKSLNDFGRALVIGQRASTWQYILSEKAFVEAGSKQAQLAILRLQAKVVSQPVVDADESQYLFRILASEASKAPEFDQRRDEVDRDARKLAAYKAMLAEKSKWTNRVQSEKLEDIATKESVIVHTPAQFRKRVPDMVDNVGGLSVPSIGEFGKSAALTDAVFEVADRAFTKGDLKTMAYAERSGLAAVDSRLSLVLFRVESYKPITKRDYELQIMFNLATGMIQQGLTTKNTADPLSEDALAKRVNFVRDEASDEDEDEKDAEKKATGDGGETAGAE